MDAVLYTGNGTSQTISGLGFSPDLVWTKLRSIGFGHRIWDTVRGATKRLETHANTAEATESTALTAFTSDGFTVGAESNVNLNNGSLVGWAWDAGSSTVSNTDGTITSSVRANPTAGFSIVSYSSSSNAVTVGHGLNSAPEFIILKDRNNAHDWIVITTLLSNTTDYLVLNSSAASANFGVAAPTSTTFIPSQSSNSDYIAYALHLSKAIARLVRTPAMETQVATGLLSIPDLGPGGSCGSLRATAASIGTCWILQEIQKIFQKKPSTPT